MVQSQTATPSSITRTLRFPPGFLWGAATSAHQVEGNNTNSDWWRSEQLELVPYRSGEACDHFHRYPDDLRLLAHEVGLNAYRFSVEWARIEPEPGQFDQRMLDHYRRMLETVRGLGVEPVVTLHHFTNPLWLADRGGWIHADTPRRFAAYADRVVRAFGDLAPRWWVTINEPSVSPLLGRIVGCWPPHERNNVVGYVRHMRNVLAGHRLARAALKASSPGAMASMALHLNPMEPISSLDPTDHIAALVYDWLWQGLLLRLMAPSLDWVGVNYYFRLHVRWDIWPWSLFAPPTMGPGEKTEFGWEIYPRGLGTVLKRAGSLGKPVMVTENGIADADDDQRPRFIREHIYQAHRAIRDGVDLRGYLHWSLLDNFEWAEGYTRRFGLVQVDFATQQRTVRPSAYLYGDIARANAIDLPAAAPPVPTPRVVT